MISQKDSEFLSYLMKGTAEGKIRWLPTASDDQFVVSLKGKYSVVVAHDGRDYWIRMIDDTDREMLRIADDDDPAGRISELFDSARRVALNVDAAIDDIIGGE